MATAHQIRIRTAQVVKYCASTSPDPPSLHYDRRTTQRGDGTRYAGVVDGIFAMGEYVHIV